MIELDFDCIGSRPDPAAAGPTIALTLSITENTSTPVYAVALRCQLRIEPQRRRYDQTEAAAIRDLFGERARWGDTLKPMQLGYVNQVVPSFTGVTQTDLLLPVSYDVEVAANKYLCGLHDGEVPLLLLFSGTVFVHGAGGIEVQPIQWHKETRYRLPVQVWQQTMQLHFPNSAWLRLPRETFDALQQYRAREQLMTTDDAISRLLKVAGDG